MLTGITAVVALARALLIGTLLVSTVGLTSWKDRVSEYYQTRSMHAHRLRNNLRRSLRRKKWLFLQIDLKKMWGDELPPPPPPAPPPPVLALARFTFIVLPSKLLSFMLVMAALASSPVENVTKPNPRDRPVSRSRITTACAVAETDDQTGRKRVGQGRYDSSRQEQSRIGQIPMYGDRKDEKRGRQLRTRD